ncbi:hypothetical protein VOLCADRAFT_93134 [Volvox carteri f. nagariensis]|uniref:Uncharacterized protein n=1 Tax=Volvox carteri f. nagariensis TaxID=3068 RepID=D8U1E2_VOLCA|nr:uncharacterized protein VOLCADRAFT_93134 [Volvox carteri f. nagariensis]EFJ46397.1 hypothetical protein VOLCADRAFT_93134 [Volvox carteri f. nagariensis]|eukprot:XP_002952550.1 hypothetical protein VOLCADRAFT_93134 [Volvox carteri f. nagariensis]
MAASVFEVPKQKLTKMRRLAIGLRIMVKKNRRLVQKQPAIAEMITVVFGLEDLLLPPPGDTATTSGEPVSKEWVNCRRASMVGRPGSYSLDSPALRLNSAEVESKPSADPPVHIRISAINTDG